MKKIWTSVLALCVIVLGIFIAAPFAVPQIALASPSFATIDAAGLIQRISNLEDRVSALEAQLSTFTSMSHTHSSTSQAPASQAPASQAPAPQAPSPTATPLVATQTSGAVAYDTANIVNAPGGSVLRTVSAGMSLDIVGYYNDANNITWYKLRDGGWVRYTSVSNAPSQLPYIYYPEK